jgi:hypothetical protein
VPEVNVRAPISPSPRVVLNGQEIESHTLVVNAGAYALTLSTTLLELDIGLHSSYVGHNRATMTQVSELVLAPDREPEPASREVRAVEVPVVVARRRCLLDHLERLQEVLDELGHGLAEIHLADDAYLAVEA